MFINIFKFVRSRVHAPRGRRVGQGFTLIETLIVLAIVSIVTVMAVIVTSSVMPQVRADSAMQLFAAQLNLDRETAIDQRRSLEVTLQGTNEMVAVRLNLDGTTTPLSDYTLPYGMIYTLITGIPDTPDGFGDEDPVYFTNPSGVYCKAVPCTLLIQSDGSVLDTSGNIVNGTLFIGMPGQPDTARAITILGATGRIKTYSYVSGSAWN